MNKLCDNQKKISIHGRHVVWLEISYLDKLNKILENENLTIQEWIKELCKEELNIELNNSDQISLLDNLVKMELYKNKSEWIREKVREKLSTCK